jgi:hypothetical protein
LKVNITAGFAQFIQILNVTAGQPYALHAWVRGTAAAGATSPFRVTFGLRQYEAPYSFHGSTEVVLGSAWVRIVVPLVTPPGTSGSLRCLVVLLTNGGPGMMWVDDTSLQLWPLPGERREKGLQRHGWRL